jgi:cobalt/nickel transport system permease protein
VLVSIVGTAVLVAGVVGWFASTHPDGLEWTYQDHFTRDGRASVDNSSALVAAVDDFQTKWSPMSDYTRRAAPLGQPPAEAQEEPAARWPNVSAWGSLAGVLGTAVTLGLLVLAGRALRRRRAAEPHATAAP